ncbi:MAG: NADH:flavin oxidoreductase/NADH oxidase [Beijerinckiaceae bacterium]
MSRLFEPLNLGSLALPNRIIIAPMCQYSAQDGLMNDWHLMHLGSLALSGAGLLIIEATAVTPEGRITPGDTGLYNDATEAAMTRVIHAVRRYSPMPIAIQLAHAGRKASSERPWKGGAQIAPDAPEGWQAVAPSPVPHNAHEVAPTGLDGAGLSRLRDAFADAARRAARMGFDGIELHGAHGYLLHEFLSPISNQRTDAYGGSLENRMRFPLEVFDAVRAAFPPERPVWMRVSGTDWVEGGWTIAETIAFAQALAARGCAAMHVSSGGVSSQQKITLGPGYQVPLAAQVKAAVTIPVIAVGLITDAEQAEAIIAHDEADAIGIARGIIYDPRWPWHAAAKLGAKVTAPQQYWRSNPRDVPDLFKDAFFGQR